MERQAIRRALRPLPAFEDLLQRREIGIAPGIIGDDFAVDQACRQIAIRNGIDQRPELVGPVLAVTGVDMHFIALGRDQCAIAIELDFVHPAVARRHLVDQRGQLRFAIGGQRRRLARGFGFVALAPIARRCLAHLLDEGATLLTLQRVFALLVRRNFCHRPAGQNAGQLALDQRIACFDVLVLQFAQQPVLALFALARFQAHQQPFAAHAFACEAEMKMALFEIGNAFARDRLPRSAVP